MNKDLESNYSTKSKQMTLVVQNSSEKVICVAMSGTGTMTIDWNDGSPSETHTLLDFIFDDWYQETGCKYEYCHRYTDDSARFISIIGENITYLRCSGIALTSLDVSNNTALVELLCDRNQLSTLDVSKNIALTDLSCRDNQLTALDVSKNTELAGLVCDGNGLTSLDVSNNVLELLSCSDNRLTTLNLSNKALELLNCSGNRLTKLDVSNNTALVELLCDRNQLSTLDVSKNIALTSLNCSVNQLTSLNLSKSFTQLTNFNVGENSALKKIYCDGTHIGDLDWLQNIQIEKTNYQILSLKCN